MRQNKKYVSIKKSIRFCYSNNYLNCCYYNRRWGAGYYFYKTSQEKKGGSFEEAILLPDIAEKITKTETISGGQYRYYKFWVDKGQEFLITISGDVEVWIYYPDYSSAERLERGEGTRGASVSAISTDYYYGYYYVVVQSFDSGRYTYTLTVQMVDETADLPSEDLLAKDWRVYQNKKQGFSFSYPENFQLLENDFTRGSLLASVYIEEPIPFSLVLLQDIYMDSAQTPLISLDVVKTSKTIEQLLGHVRKVINDQTKVLEDPGAPYCGAPPPEIKSIETVTIGDLKMTKVVHDIGPGGPNPILSEYYMAHPGYVFVFSANYGTPCGHRDCGTTEKEILSKILSTFKFIETDETVQISVAIDIESFDLMNKTFEGRLRTGERRKVKVITTDSTEFYRTSEPTWEKEYFTFSELYSNTSPTWPLTVKGVFEEENIIKANEVFIIAQ